MIRRSRIASALAVAGLVASLAACSSGAASSGAGTDDGTTTVAVLTSGYSIPVTKAAMDKVVAEGQAKGWTMKLSDASGDLNKLNSLYQDAVTQNVDAIVDGFNGPADISVGLAAAKTAGIPVFGVVAGDKPDPDMALNVTSDATDMGAQTAQALVDIAGKGTTALVVTYSPLPIIKTSTDAALKVFEDNDVTVLKTLEVSGPVNAAEEVSNFMTDALTAYPDPNSIDMVWTPGDTWAALPASLVISKAGRNIEVSAFDASDASKAAIKSGGPFKVSILQDFDRMVSTTIDAIEGTLNGTMPAEPFIALPGTLVTADTLK